MDKLFPSRELDMYYRNMLANNLKSALSRTCHDPAYSDCEFLVALVDELMVMDDVDEVILQPDIVYWCRLALQHRSHSSQERLYIAALAYASLSFSLWMLEKPFTTVNGFFPVENGWVDLPYIVLKLYAGDCKMVPVKYSSTEISLGDRIVLSIEQCKNKAFGGIPCLIPQHIGPSGIPVLAHQFWIGNYLSSIAQNVKSSLGAVSLDVVQEPSPEVISLADEGLNILNHCWPEMSCEVANSVKTLIFLKPPSSSSFSDLTCHGATFFVHWKYNPVWWAENITHEASHIRLNTILAVESHLTNPQYIMKDTPWREDPRPVLGVYHACYVYSRVAELLRRMCQYDIPYSGIEERLSEVKGQLGVGITLLDTYAKGTKNFDEVMDQMRTQLQYI